MKPKHKDLPPKFVKRVKGIFEVQLGLEPEEVRLDSFIQDELGADSLDEIELIMAFEESFDVSIDVDAFELNLIKTVRQAAEYIKTLVEAQP